MGKTGEYPSPLSRYECPPEAIENRTITSVSEWHKNALLSAGRRTGENGKQFGPFDAMMRDPGHGTEFAGQASK